jgi:hypothetical protein
VVVINELTVTVNELTILCPSLTARALNTEGSHIFQNNMPNQRKSSLKVTENFNFTVNFATNSQFLNS